jgi:hypothetical protein
MGEPGSPAVRRFLSENSLSLFFLGLFLTAVVGQAIAGHDALNEDQISHGGDPVSLWTYVTSSSFGQAVMENWQSEYLQFTLFMLATVWLLQRGSPESKELHKAGRESEQEQRVGRHSHSRSPLWARVGGVRTAIYSNSLLIAMAVIFVGAWFAQSVTGWTAYNDQQAEHQEATVSWLSYIGTSDFWEATFQNWQSEFLAVGSFAVLTIYLRQRGSPESKPVGAAHDSTGRQV